MILYFLIFFLLAFFTLFKSEKNESWIFVITGILLFLLAAFRNSELDRDYLGYIEYYNAVINNSFSRIEPSFILISKMIDKLFDNNLLLFIIYAFLGVSLKFYAISKLTNLRLLSSLIYFSSFFLLFEMTQIRVGVATGLLLLSIVPIKERKLGLFLIIASLAFFFHYSAIVIFPLYFLKGDIINLKFYVILIPIAYLIYYLEVNLFFMTKIITIPLIQIKMDSYYYKASINNNINILNFVQLSRIVLAYLFLWKWQLITETNAFGIILIKIYVIALFIFVAFANVPTISSRVSEFLLIVEIILIPFLYIILKPKYLSHSVVIGIGLAFLSFSMFYTKLFTF